MNKELVIDVLENKNGLEEAISRFMLDIRENKDEEYLKDNFLEIFYCDINYIKLLKKKIRILQKKLYSQMKSVA